MCERLSRIFIRVDDINCQMESAQRNNEEVDSGWRHFTFEWSLKNIFGFKNSDKKTLVESTQTVCVTGPAGAVFEFGFHAEVYKDDIYVYMSRLEGPDSIAYVRCEGDSVMQTQFALVQGGRGDDPMFDCSLDLDQFVDLSRERPDVKISVHCSVQVCPSRSLFQQIDLFGDDDKFQAQPGNVVSNAMGSLYDDSGEMPLADAELRCTGGSVRCHRVVLAAWSDVFKAMFSHESMKEAQTGLVEMEDCRLKVANLFVEYLYKGRGPLESRYRFYLPFHGDGSSLHFEKRNPKDLLDLLILADKYQVQVVADHARHLLGYAIYCSQDNSVVYCGLRRPLDGSSPWQYQFYAMVATSIAHGMEDVSESLLHCFYMEDEADLAVFHLESPLEKLQGWLQFAKDIPEIGRKMAAFFEDKKKRPVIRFTSVLSPDLSSTESDCE